MMLGELSLSSNHVSCFNIHALPGPGGSGKLCDCFGLKMDYDELWFKGVMISLA